MPTYYVYDVQTGVIVQKHTSIDAASGDTLACSRDEVLAVVDDALLKNDLDVLEVTTENAIEQQQSRRAFRVDPKTRELVAGE